jgi:hypothetical protein
MYLANAVDVRQIREQVSTVGELVDHQLDHVQQERSTVGCVLHIRHTTQVLQVKCFQLGAEGREGQMGASMTVNIVPASITAHKWVYMLN